MVFTKQNESFPFKTSGDQFELIDIKKDFAVIYLEGDTEEISPELKEFMTNMLKLKKYNFIFDWRNTDYYIDLDFIYKVNNICKKQGKSIYITGFPWFDGDIHSVVDELKSHGIEHFMTFQKAVKALGLE
jgi:hypothetical protein